MNLIKRWLSYLVMWGHLKCISLMSYCCRCWSDHSAYEKCFNIKNSVIMIFLELFITFMNFLHTAAGFSLDHNLTKYRHDTDKWHHLNFRARFYIWDADGALSILARPPMLMASIIPPYESYFIASWHQIKYPLPRRSNSDLRDRHH